MIAETSIPLLCPGVPSQIGDVLHESRVTPGKGQKTSSIDAQITNKMVILGGEHVFYSFDLRFSVNEEELTFYVGDDHYTYQLLLGDYFRWRDCLKLFINQKGFHEQFKAIKKIGQGSFASVYLVKKLENNEQYAVKAFSKESAYSEEHGKECLIKEIEIMRQLNSKHNMKLNEVFESENSLYLVFELLDGGMLYDKIKNKKQFNASQTRTIIQGILQGLKEMHSKGIMHRDLKPQNILMRSESECVIADYGLAEFVDEKQYLFTRCGTPGYVAPEVINITDMTTKYRSVCDMFSLGLIFHTLLFGKSIFVGKTYNEVLKENRACNFTLDDEKYNSLPYETLDLLKKMLRVNPEERITSEQAIDHPYFKAMSEELESADQVHELKPLTDFAKRNSSQISTDTESPILTSANTKRRELKNVKKDSCIGLKIGKESIFTGKTETVGTLSSGKVSGFGGQLIKGFDPSKLKSKFTKKEDKENVQDV